MGHFMGHYFTSMEVDMTWRITPFGGRVWSLDEAEFILGVLVSRQTPNVKETKLDLRDNSLGNVAARNVEALLQTPQSHSFAPRRQ